MSGHDDGFNVEAITDYVCLTDRRGEIVYWDRQEWVEDPDLVITIAAVINHGHVHGSESLRKMLKGKRLIR